jgi:hypothetical protein
MTTTKINLLMEKFSISQTMAKLMEKYNCQTPEEYRVVRKDRKANAPKPSKKVRVEKVIPQKGFKKRK